MPKYTSTHQWIYLHFGKANQCKHCGKNEGYFEWANISGEYKREIEDWVPLCKPCHLKFDNVPKRSWETRRKKYGSNGMANKRKDRFKGNKITVDQVSLIKIRLRNGESQRSIAKDFSVSFSTIGQIKRELIWVHVK